MEGNGNYNPQGSITNAFYTTTNVIIDGGGNSATPTNMTAMTVVGSPKMISVTIGSAWTSTHTLVIKIDGTQVVSLKAAISAGTVYTFTLAPGETFYIQYQTSEATFVVSGE